MAIEKKKHAKFSASAAYRWLACPGSVALSQKAPPQTESKYAEEGTLAHECLEELLSLYSTSVPHRSFAGKFTKEMIAHAQKAVAGIMGRIPKNAKCMSETKSDLSFIHPDMWGTADAVIVEEFGRLTVIDYKYGAGIPVDPEENPQLIFYALGIAHHYNYNFKDVALVIIQPRADHPRGPVREWVISIDELLKWSYKFREGVVLANQSDAPLSAGDHCRFCPAAPICPEISSRALRQAKVDFGPASGQLALPEPSLFFEGRNLGQTLDALDRVETWIGAVRVHAHQLLERGEKIAGYKLVQKRSTRKWTDLTVAIKAALRDLSEGAFTEPELKSPAQLEKSADNEEDKRLVEKFIGKYASSISSGTTFAKESDPRPSINSLIDDFGVAETKVLCDESLKGENDMAKKTAKKKPAKKKSKK